MTYARAMKGLAGAVAAAMALYHMWAIATSPPEAVIFRGTHLLFAMALVFILFPLRAGRRDQERGPGAEDWLLCALSIWAVGRLFLDYDWLVNRIPYIDDPRPADIIGGWILVALILEATRRVIGWALPLTSIVFLIWSYFFTDVGMPAMLDQLYLTTDGIFGSTLGVSAGFVVIFVLFGSFMERSGVGKLFMDFALALTGRSSGGPGKVAVVSSSLFGSVSGSAVANVMVTGQVTIPLMKRSGFRPQFAAGVEAVASTGGQIMPPIMGAAAFVMAEFLGVSYLQVVTWALIPAVLYYVATFAAVHFEAKRVGLAGLPDDEVPRLRQVLAENWHLFLPILMIVIGLFAGYSAPLVALVATLACFPAAALRANSRHHVTLGGVWDAMLDGARNSLGIAMACACAGIVIGLIALTGLGITFTQLVVNVANNNLVLALILTMMAGIILGMGMPTTPAYIVMVSLLVPALIAMGVVTPAAHLFAFYFAILSAITPPVALAVFAAAGLAKTDMWSSGWAAMKIGAAGFIVPFIFVFQPALLLIGTWGEVALAVASATAGCLLLAASLHAYLLRAMPMWERVALFIAALSLIKPGVLTDAVGIILGGGVVLLQLVQRRRAAVA
ncbi:TRAP transporter permease [Falsiroseomonas selenitidurans]|uniref:TRAP transporter permease n=1 Tax=Falsiroseomonas selenitidurans TaxID=2716335 RepID=A0ABX1DYI9_9PROT|nr:TRAP transporter permease [Falsiroseomonas selenitidurans]NKC29960.1 TRAP transporter permease [Falsiroseomonas selenitidurans]